MSMVPSKNGHESLIDEATQYDSSHSTLQPRGIIFFCSPWILRDRSQSSSFWYLLMTAGTSFSVFSIRVAMHVPQSLLSPALRRMQFISTSFSSSEEVND